MNAYIASYDVIHDTRVEPHERMIWYATSKKEAKLLIRVFHGDGERVRIRRIALLYKMEEETT